MSLDLRDSRMCDSRINIMIHNIESGDRSYFNNIDDVKFLLNNINERFTNLGMSFSTINKIVYLIMLYSRNKDIIKTTINHIHIDVLETLLIDACDNYSLFGGYYRYLFIIYILKKDIKLIENTPLHIICSTSDETKRQFKLVQTIVKKGINMNNVDIRGNTPLDNLYFTLITLLLQDNLNKRRSLYRNIVTIIKFLVKNGADINNIDYVINTYSLRLTDASINIKLLFKYTHKGHTWSPKWSPIVSPISHTHILFKKIIYSPLLKS